VQAQERFTPESLSFNTLRVRPTQGEPAEATRIPPEGSQATLPIVVAHRAKIR